MSWWYPRLNRRGDIVSGNGTILLNGAPLPTPTAGQSPQWLGDPEDRLVLIAGATDRAQIIDVRTGQVHADLGVVCNARVGNTSGVCAGAEHWCAWGAGAGLVYDGQLTAPGAAPGAVDQRTGFLHYLCPYQSDHREVVIEGTVVQRALATEIVAGEDCATWGCYEPTRTLWGWARETGLLRLSPLPAGEELFAGIPVRTPEGLWLVTLTHKGLILYPWGGHDGYVIDGEFFYHDARFLNGVIRIVATTSRGALVDVGQSLAAPRTDLRTYRPSAGGPVDPPIDPPIDPPVELPEDIMDHVAMNTFANEWWANHNIRGRSTAMGGNLTDPATGVSYCLPLQQWAFRRLMTEAYYRKGYTWALLFWKSGLIQSHDNEITIQRKLHDVGEDVYCMLRPFEYKDAVVRMGHVDAELNFLPPFTPSTPGDESRVGPAPSLEFMLEHDHAPDGEGLELPIEPPPTEPSEPSAMQLYLDQWLADNPDAQEYVTKLYHVEEGAVAPADATHVVRLHSHTDPTNHLTVAGVMTAKGAAIADMLLSM